jgi:hypothetical protein
MTHSTHQIPDKVLDTHDGPAREGVWPHTSGKSCLQICIKVERRTHVKDGVNIDPRGVCEDSGVQQKGDQNRVPGVAG